MKKLFRFLGLVGLVAALPVLSIYASSGKEIFNQKDDFLWIPIRNARLHLC